VIVNQARMLAYLLIPEMSRSAVEVDLPLEVVMIHMLRHAWAGFDAKGSLSFLLVLNGGAILGALAGSRVADHLGPSLVIFRLPSHGRAARTQLVDSLVRLLEGRRTHPLLFSDTKRKLYRYMPLC
jgi:hypothetical protein